MAIIEKKITRYQYNVLPDSKRHEIVAQAKVLILDHITPQDIQPAPVAEKATPDNVVYADFANANRSSEKPSPEETIEREGVAVFVTQDEHITRLKPAATEVNDNAQSPGESHSLEADKIRNNIDDIYNSTQATRRAA